MSRVLVTGMSGAGKSTLLAELSRRGYATADTDYGDWTRPDGDWDEAQVEPLLRRGATLTLDGRRPVRELADAVERLLTG